MNAKWTMALGASALVGLVGCGGGAGECGPAECAAVCADGGGAKAAASTTASAATPAAAGGGASMTAFQQSLVDPLLADVKAGIRPWNDEGIGVCQGKRECEAFLGTAPGVLPPGDFMVKAELRVPKMGEEDTWKVKFVNQCTTTSRTGNSETTSNSNYEKEYSVRYINEERPARLMPLFTVTSPNRGGERTCQWQVIGLHPDGDQVYSGSYTLPDAAK